MLNKEELITSADKQYHFSFMVGIDANEDYYAGWVGEPFGVYPPVGETLSPIPYWKDESNYLECIKTNRPYTDTYFKSIKQYRPQLTNEVTVFDSAGNEIGTYYDYDDLFYVHTYKYSDGFVMDRTDVGKIFHVIFDPPPDGYLDPNTMRPI